MNVLANPLPSRQRHTHAVSGQPNTHYIIVLPILPIFGNKRETLHRVIVHNFSLFYL